MANKRQLKKHIQTICGELATELLITSHMFDNLDQDKVQAIIYQIAILQESSLANCTFAYDKVVADFDSRHAYNKARHRYYTLAFNQLLKQFNNSVLDIVKEMNAVLPTDVRDTFKAAANR